ncbi:hypothetical protein CHS0354_034997 [Potamilus streckersoni]|uniref:Carboxylesterase type B domain-containing protein n=1 Tax=Potamilus streckersoni TaxID=2493646 RepID=A0AAE0SDD4_9BIVA|nr:hypothetical protein CHS0354_034997 [Potamilus streckersoni]
MEMFTFKLRVVCVVLMTSVCKGRVYTKQMGARIIKTRYGDIKGVLAEFSNPKFKPVDSYRGLQYGTTFGGRMRFMPPASPLERWKYTRLTFSMRPVCFQNEPNETNLVENPSALSGSHLARIVPFILSKSEDCLTLNVYVPSRDGLDMTELKNQFRIGKD